jgi:hypothetical protein
MKFQLRASAIALSLWMFSSGQMSAAQPQDNGQSTPKAQTRLPAIARTPGVFDPNSLQKSNGLWFEGDLLYWKSSMGSLDYGVESNSKSSVHHGHVKQPHFDWNWGGRLGLGYKLPHDKWDLFVNYTYVHGQAHGDAGDSNRVVFPSFATRAKRGGPSSFYAHSAKAHWHMNLNMADIELGRCCFAGTWLRIRPFIGVRGLVIDQDYNVEYRGGTVAPRDVDKVRMDTDYWGAGIRMGVDTLWGLGRGFSVYGNGSASLLSADFDVHAHEKLKKNGICKINLKRDVDTAVVTADLALGLQWDYLFSRDRYHVGIKLGWEFDIFFDQNQLFNFVGNQSGAIHTRNDDLTFQGVTLGFRFDF